MFIMMRKEGQDTVAWLHDTATGKGCVWTTNRDLATDFSNAEATSLLQALQEEGRPYVFEIRTRNDDQPAPRSLAEIVSEIESLRTAMADTTRRLRTVLGDETFVMDSLYREVAGMRAASTLFTAIVDDMCRQCFPMAIHPVSQGILRFIAENSPIPEDRLRQRARSSNPQRPDVDWLIDKMIEAGYVRRSNTAGRNMLIATDTGRAAQDGIMWAQAS